MLSEQIDAMAERLEPYRHAGLQAAPEAVELAVAALRAVAEEARHLEAATVPEPARRQLHRIDPADIHAGRVVPLQTRLPRRFRTIRGGPGDAA